MCLNKLFDTNCTNDVIGVNDDLMFDSVYRKMLIELKRNDIILSKLFDLVVDEECDRVAFFLRDEVLFRKWRDPRVSSEVVEPTLQIVVPRCLISLDCIGATFGYPCSCSSWRFKDHKSSAAEFLFSWYL